MQLKIIDQPGCLYLKVQAERIDAAAAIQFKDLVRRALTPSPQRKIIDLEQVNFIDSTGLGALISLQKAQQKAQQNAQQNAPNLAICSLHPQVAKVFKLTRMDEVFDIYATAEAALKAASASPAF
ncbi:MAG: STAS domain-containing protein, partial [Paracoccaceae bacterium]